MQIQQRPEIEDIKPFYRLETLAVNCDADLPIAADAIKEIHVRIKAIKAWHQEVVGPIKKGIAAFEDRIRPPRQLLEKLEATIKGKMESYWDSQRKAKELAERKKRDSEIEAAKQLASENLEVAISTGSEVAKEAALNFDKQAQRLEEKPLDLSQTVRTGNAVIAQTTVWAWEVVDLGKVPLTYLSIDEKKLNAIAKNFGDAPFIIPGVNFFQKSRAAVSRS
jgi:Skp family chaperone for outer membrane proteins